MRECRTGPDGVGPSPVTAVTVPGSRSRLLRESRAAARRSGSRETGGGRRGPSVLAMVHTVDDVVPYDAT